MRQVTKEKFFAKIGPLDVHPRSERMQTIWEDRRRSVIGRSTPGYLSQDEDGQYTDKKTYYLVEEP